MNRQPLLDLINKRAIIRKEVTLASGQKSNYYIDARSLFLHGPSATLIGEAIYELTKELPITAIGGPAVGALPLTVAATMHYHKMGREMEGFFVRKEAKEHGLQKIIEGVLPFCVEKKMLLWRCDECGKEMESEPLGHSDYGGEVIIQGPRCQECDQLMESSKRPGVAICEDVFTTGGSVMTAIEAVHEAGVEVVAVVGLVDRLAGARERFEKMGIQFLPFCTIKELDLPPS